MMVRTLKNPRSPWNFYQILRSMWRNNLGLHNTSFPDDVSGCVSRKLSRFAGLRGVTRLTRLTLSFSHMCVCAGVRMRGCVCVMCVMRVITLLFLYIKEIDIKKDDTGRKTAVSVAKKQ